MAILGGVCFLTFFFGSPQSRNAKSAIMLTSILKCQFEALRVFFWKNVRKQTPPKMANFGGVYFLTFFQKTNRFGARTLFFGSPGTMVHLTLNTNWLLARMIRQNRWSFQKEHNLFKLDTNNTFLNHSVKKKFSFKTFAIFTSNGRAMTSARHKISYMTCTI